MPGSGNGAKSLGQELAASQAFASCQVTRVFKTVCFRAPEPSRNERRQSHQVTNDDRLVPGHGYSLRQVFAEAAAYCMGN